MANIAIRNLADGVVVELKQQAREHNRSFEAELREILANTVRMRRNRREFLAHADRIAAMTPDAVQTDSAQLIREDRDR